MEKMLRGCCRAPLELSLRGRESTSSSNSTVFSLLEALGGSRAKPKKQANRSPRASNKVYALYTILLVNTPKPYWAQTGLGLLIRRIRYFHFQKNQSSRGGKRDSRFKKILPPVMLLPERKQISEILSFGSTAWKYFFKDKNSCRILQECR
jgi:hypothetical protein